MRRGVRLRGSVRGAAALVALLVACTPGAEVSDDPPTPSDGGSPTTTPIRIPVLAPAAQPVDVGVVDGMTLAVERANRGGGVDDRPLELVFDVESLDRALSSRPPAILVAGPSAPVAAARTDLELARVPVVVLGGDLYTARELHRYAFQTSVPIRWQAGVIASYLVEDRGADLVALLTPPGSDGTVVGDAFEEAFVREGGRAPSTLPVGSMPEALDAAAGADAVVAMLPPGRLSRVVRSLQRLPDPPALVLPPEGLALRPPVPAGAVVSAPYTWAGWAGMLPRVRAFREAFRARFGRAPGGLEQEGYDAVMAVAEALRRTGGEGGDALVRALEGFRDETYSSLPVRLGPDDHVLAEESHLGLFTVTDPSGAPVGEEFGEVPWRPIMRTFTTDGEKVNLLDRDKRVFFPFWRKKRPTPKYPRSEFGIVAGPVPPS